MHAERDIVIPILSVHVSDARIVSKRMHISSKFLDILVVSF